MLKLKKRNNTWFFSKNFQNNFEIFKALPQEQMPWKRFNAVKNVKVNAISSKTSENVVFNE